MIIKKINKQGREGEGLLKAQRTQRIREPVPDSTINQNPPLLPARFCFFAVIFFFLHFSLLNDEQQGSFQHLRSQFRYASFLHLCFPLISFMPFFMQFLEFSFDFSLQLSMKRIGLTQSTLSRFACFLLFFPIINPSGFCIFFVRFCFILTLIFYSCVGFML